MAEENQEPQFKRYDPRILVGLPVKLEREGKARKARTLDLSRGGLSVEASGLRAKEEVGLVLNLPGIGGLIRCRGQVMRTEEGRAGIRFLDLSKDDLANIERFILYNIRFLFVGPLRRFLLKPLRTLSAALITLVASLALQAFLFIEAGGAFENYSDLTLLGILLLNFPPAYLAAGFLSYVIFPFSWREYRLYKGLKEQDLDAAELNEAEEKGVSRGEMERILKYYGAAKETGGIDTYRTIHYLALAALFLTFLYLTFEFSQALAFLLYPDLGVGEGF